MQADGAEVEPGDAASAAEELGVDEARIVGGATAGGRGAGVGVEAEGMRIARYLQTWRSSLSWLSLLNGERNPPFGSTPPSRSIVMKGPRIPE